MKPVSVSLTIEGVSSADEAVVTKLGSDNLYDENTRDSQDLVTPTEETIACKDELTIELPSYTLARIDFER